MGIERLKQLIMQYKESVSYYRDAKNAYNFIILTSLVVIFSYMCYLILMEAIIQWR